MKLLDNLRTWWSGPDPALFTPPDLTADLVENIIEASRPAAQSLPIDEIWLHRRGWRTVLSVKTGGQWHKVVSVGKVNAYGIRITPDDIAYAEQCGHPRGHE